MALSTAEPYTNYPSSPPPTSRRASYLILGDRGTIFKALAASQAKFDHIHRSKTVYVKSDRGNYSYDYAPLEAVLAATVPHLTANGLSLWHPLGEDDDGNLMIGTVLSHESGASIEMHMSIPAMLTYWKDGNQRERPKTIQEIASDVTYRKRYMVSAILGVSSEEDDDGAAGEGMERTVADRQGPRRNTQATPPVKPAGKPVEQSKPQLTAVPRAPSTPPPPPKEVDPPAPQEPIAPEETPRDETMAELRVVVKELFRGNMTLMAKWCTETIGKPPAEISTEAEAQKLLANAKMRKEAK
jgi:hypothetical protein